MNTIKMNMMVGNLYRRVFVIHMELSTNMISKKTTQGWQCGTSNKTFALFLGIGKE